MPNLLDERDKRTIYRKLAKEQYDNLIDLSVRNGTKIRLLDEGMVVDAYGEPDFYIERGTLSKFLKELPDSYEGTINLGHLPFSQFPFLLGTWTKKDFELVDKGNGRQALDIALNLDRDSVFVKELHRLPYDIGVSAEFTYSGEYKELEVEPGVKRYVLCINDLFIGDFGVVGECGNVNSSGIDLNMKKGGATLKLKDLFKTEEVEETAEEELAVEEETTEEDSLSEELSENSEDTEASEDSEEQPDTGELAEAVKALKAEVDAITADREALAEENEALKAELAEMKDDIKSFTESFKEMTVKMNPNIGKPKEEKKELTVTRSSDGIGEL